MDGLINMTDEELVREYVNGSNHAFDLLLEHNQEKLFTYILLLVNDRERANDVFQETFAKAIVCLQNGLWSPKGKFCNWLMRIAHNVIMDQYRKKRNLPRVELSKDNDLQNVRAASIVDKNRENEIINEQTLRDVARLMNNLPEAQREVVYMRYYQKLSFREISNITGVSIGTSLGRMRYALINMRRMVRGHAMSLCID